MAGGFGKMTVGTMWFLSVLPLWAAEPMEVPTFGGSNQPLEITDVKEDLEKLQVRLPAKLIAADLKDYEPIPLSLDPTPSDPPVFAVTKFNPPNRGIGLPEVIPVHHFENLNFEDRLKEPAKFIPPIQVLTTRRPSLEDGLAGNRQVSLTPFPNLDMESGPLAVHQLPWYNKVPDGSPHWLLKNTSYHTMLGFKRSNGINDHVFGWYNSFETGLPFWQERDVGFQIGVIFEPTTLSETIVGFTGGLFHQAIWPVCFTDRFLFKERFSWGVVYDLLLETEEGMVSGQIRPKLSYALAPHREIGVWGVAPLQDDKGVASSRPIRVEPSALGVAFIRQTFPSELDWTIFAGYVEAPGEGFAGTYLTYRFSELGSGIFSAQKNFVNDAYAFYGGVRIDFHPRGDCSMISGDPQNRFRPFLRTLDHINLQVRKTLD